MLNFRGAYASGIVYEAGDVVASGAQAYLATESTTAAPPNAPWTLFSAQAVQGVSEILIHRKSLVDLHEPPQVTWDGQQVSSVTSPADYERVPFVSKRYDTLTLSASNARPVSLAATPTRIAVLDAGSVPPTLFLYDAAGAEQTQFAMPSGFRSGGVALSGDRIYVCDVSHTARVLVFRYDGTEVTASGFAVTGVPIDIAVDRNGKTLYVLSDTGIASYLVETGQVHQARAFTFTETPLDTATKRGLYLGRWMQVLAADGAGWRVFSFDTEGIRIQSQEVASSPVLEPLGIAGDGETLYFIAQDSRVLSRFYDVSLPLWGVKVALTVGNRTPNISRPFLMGVYPQHWGYWQSDNGGVPVVRHRTSGTLTFGLTDSTGTPTGVAHEQRFQHVPTSLPLTFPALGANQGWYLQVPAGVQVTHLYNRTLAHRDSLSRWTYDATTRRWTTRGFPTATIGEYTVDLEQQST